MNNQTAPEKVRVAAVQLESRPGCITANHAHATLFIEEAARKGAKLVVLPELFASGYIPNPRIWDAAERQNGPTVSWLKRMSKEFGIYLGAGLVETDGVDFLNVFVLTGPEGEIAGRAQKDNAEAYCFKRGQGCHIINTPIGRIGIGICADNHYTSFLALMQNQSIDIMLMPHAWPTPFKSTKMVSDNDLQRANQDIKIFASLYAGSLGVPVVFVNSVGPMDRMAGFLGKLMDPAVFRLQVLHKLWIQTVRPKES